jgi:hypothetical protein
MRGRPRVSNLSQKFVVQELIKYYEYWKKDDLYQERIKDWWRTGQQDPNDPYRGAYREALRQCR